jgi:hypothetical protein
MTKDLPRGVTYKKTRRKYIARIGVRGKSISLGSFDTAAEAEAAYAAAVAVYGPRDNIGLTDEQKAKLDAFAAELGVGRVAAIMEAIESYTGQGEITRERLLQEIKRRLT